MTSPALSGRLESAGAFTTRIPSFVPKYSPRSAFSLTRSSCNQLSPKQKRNPASIIIPGPRRWGMGVGAMGGATKLHAMSMSSATSVAVLVSLARRYSICTVSPGASLRASSISLCPGADSSSSSDFTPASPVPLNFVMMSPAFSPAFSAGPPGVTASSLAPSLSVSGEASVRTTTPIRPGLSLYEKAQGRGSPGARGGRGERGGRGGCCAASHAGPMSATATAAMIHFRNIMNGFLRASQPNIGDAGDVRVNQLLHQGHPLLPEFDELVVAQLRRRPAQPGQLAVDDGNAVFQLGHQGSRSAAHDASRGAVALELFLQGRRLLLRPRQLGGVDLPRPERREHDQAGERRRGREADAAPAPHPTPALGDDRVANRGPAVARGPKRRQRLELGDALIQRLQLHPARGALVQVPARPGRPFVGSQREQIVHRAVHHRAAPSMSSMPRSRACARASCDLEKLTVLPISSAISSCVYPSTSCSHTTDRDVSLSRSSARSRSIRAGRLLCTGLPGAVSSSSSSATRTCSRRMRISAFEAAILRIHPHSGPSPRYDRMLFTTSRNVS